MFFKDHLKIVTDAGAVLHLGWDYDAPYFLDPLNGVDVDLQTAQGINQIGATVIARAFLEKCGFDYNHRPGEE